MAAALVDSARQYALSTRSCGALYLHVIHYNWAAIRFYENLQFEFFGTLDRFYVISGASYSAYVYVSYVNGHVGPLMHRLMRSVSTSISGTLTYLLSWLALASPKAITGRCSTEQRDSKLAGDDIV